MIIGYAVLAAAFAASMAAWAIIHRRDRRR